MTENNDEIMQRNLSAVSQFSDRAGGRTMSIIGEDAEGE